MNALIEENNDRTATVLLVITATLWSLGGLLIKGISWSPMAIAGMRSVIATVVFWAYLRRPKFNWSGAQVGGALAYSSTVITFVLANKMTTAANAILLQYTAPIYVAVFGAWFLGERSTKADWITVFSVLGGMVLFFLDDLSAGDLYGNILAIGSGVSFAAMTMFLRKQKAGSPMESVLLGNIITALIGLPFYFSFFNFHGSPAVIKDWVNLFLLGMVQLGVAYILYAVAIKRVNALKAVLISVIEPLLNPIWVLLVIGEVPGPWAVLGGLVVLIAVTVRGLVG